MKHRCIIFDLDGTIYFGSKLAPKANEVISLARKVYEHVFFVTNNSAKSRNQIWEKLNRLGVNLYKEELYTVSYVMPMYLKQNGYSEVYCIGTDDLRKEILNSGINPMSKNPQAIVIGFNPDFRLRDLDELANIELDEDCKLIISNREQTYPVDGGYKNAGAAPIVGAVENLINRTSDIMIGKPNTEILKTVTAGLNILPNEIVIVGDSYNSDIKMAKDYGAKGILITDKQKDDCICIKSLSEMLEIIE